eukprot:scaffold46988_cov21-Tisochrysis_lutea.AAC.1
MRGGRPLLEGPVLDQLLIRLGGGAEEPGRLWARVYIRVILERQLSVRLLYRSSVGACAQPEGRQPFGPHRDRSNGTVNNKYVLRGRCTSISMKRVLCLHPLGQVEAAARGGKAKANFGVQKVHWQSLGKSDAVAVVRYCYCLSEPTAHSTNLMVWWKPGVYVNVCPPRKATNKPA